MIIPYSVDVPMERWPITNWVIMAITCMVSFYAFDAMSGQAPLESWMLFGGGDWATDLGMLGSIMTHADIMHLVGNMVFLFVFGNAVNAKLGHMLYLTLYFVFGIVACLVPSVVSDRPGLGASGAISGVTGMFIVLFPKNNVSVFYWFGIRWIGVWVVSSWIVIGLYFAKDLAFFALEQSTGVESGVGLLAHLSGTLAGLVAASLLLITDRIRPSRGEVTLLEVLAKRG